MFVVNFMISDTHAHTLPDREGKGKMLGTQFHHKVKTKKEAIELANKVIHLTTGNRKTIFKVDDIRPQTKRVTWSNSSFTHHCEILRYGVFTGLTSNNQRGC